MKVYIRHNGGCYDYPIQMEKILNYLTERGALIVPGSTVERLYRDFSDEKYDASWMTVTPEILEKFEEWLAEVEL